MPLPDERPRQSVANLIGRFETQTKQLSSASSPSRSSSVVSHVTGDSSREEAKEKREWPPRVSNGPVEKPPLILPSLSTRNIPSALIPSNTTELGITNKWKKEAPVASMVEAEVPLTARALNFSQRQVQAEPNVFLENWRKDLPVPQTETEAETTPTLAAPPPIPQVDESEVTPTPSSVQKFATPNTRTPNVPPKTTAKTPALASSKALSSSTRTPAKTALKASASKQSLTPNMAQPLRPQHTGQSTASTTTARKLALPKTPVTPAKTPSKPDASRTKTPTSSRPKTPSTGLFAPTAASLARSRNAPPQLPTPTKKATLSSSAMDRLSKPTAASQARTAAAAPATPARGTLATSRTTAMKPKAPTTTPPKKPTKKEPVLPVATTAVVTDVVAGAVTAEAHGKDSDVDDKSEILEPESPEAVSEAQSEQIQEELLREPVEEETGRAGSGDNEVTATSAVSAPAEFGIVEGPVPDEKGPTAAHDSKDDLEDIVNLLESVSIAKPLNDIITTSDEILEIPDEDDK